MKTIIFILLLLIAGCGKNDSKHICRHDYHNRLDAKERRDKMIGKGDYVKHGLTGLTGRIINIDMVNLDNIFQGKGFSSNYKIRFYSRGYALNVRVIKDSVYIAQPDNSYYKQTIQRWDINDIIEKLESPDGDK
jgi:hypothetical protein